jgi:hypothetical protein
MDLAWSGRGAQGKTKEINKRRRKAQSQVCLLLHAAADSLSLLLFPQILVVPPPWPVSQSDVRVHAASCGRLALASRRFRPACALGRERDIFCSSPSTHAMSERDN